MKVQRGWGRLLIAVVAGVLALAVPLAGSAQPVPPGAPQPRVGGPPPPPPPPPPATPGVGLTEPMWVAVNGQTTGPFEPAVIFQKIAAREIIGETLVFTNSMSRWVRAADVAALQPALRQAQAGGPTPAGGPPGPGAPPAPPPGNEEAVQRLTQFMVGEWMTEVPGMYQGITIRTQTRYLADNSFVGFQSMMMAGAPGGSSTRPHNGRWSVQPIDDRRFTLTLTGAQMAGSFVLEILDQNRLRNSQDNYVALRIGR